MVSQRRRQIKYTWKNSFEAKRGPHCGSCAQFERLHLPQSLSGGLQLIFKEGHWLEKGITVKDCIMITQAWEAEALIQEYLNKVYDTDLHGSVL